ncbi:hypothetical protein GMOD_00002440 [Pyrenophora seminiperda CCB06]|uniref:Uncharacterized protein n=1 Tax=Pyrenophora seminiperda CCB06 TaxID=1302712 RepID=A0A3M7LXR5_9PLEO|nr:hypothetical protein GMOD_00002440 [Pyrenophora seminiperda CCB06]
MRYRFPSAYFEAPRLPSTARAYRHIHIPMRLLYTTGDWRLRWTEDLIREKIPRMRSYRTPGKKDGSVDTDTRSKEGYTITRRSATYSF